MKIFTDQKVRMHEPDQLQDFKLKNGSKIYIYGGKRKRFDCFDHIIP